MRQSNAFEAASGFIAFLLFNRCMITFLIQFSLLIININYMKTCFLSAGINVDFNSSFILPLYTQATILGLLYYALLVDFSFTLILGNHDN